MDHSVQAVPVIALDGESGTGKGTTRSLVAKKLGFHELDSGVLYRLVALLSILEGVRDNIGFVKLAKEMSVEMTGGQVTLNNQDVTEDIRTPEVDEVVPLVAKVEEVRLALRDVQLNKRILPGLVADGRDMGEIFEGPLVARFFIVTDIEERARRRVEQFRLKGTTLEFEAVLSAMRRRDELDKTRTTSPLVMHPEAVLINTTSIPRDVVAEMVVQRYHEMLLCA